MRQRSYGPRDDTPLDTGDVAWSGVYLNAEPSQLNAGLLADGINLRCRTGRPVTRRGLWKPAWLNRLDGERVLPWHTVNGQPQPFRDPNGVEWLILAADEGVFALRPYNTPLGIPLPAGVKIQTEVSFVQAFNQMFMLRGELMAPLVLETIDGGFKDMVERWDPTKAYEKGNLVASGPWIGGDVVATGATLRVTTSQQHELITGSDVQIRKTSGGKQDGRYTVTVIDEYAFEFAAADVSTVSATLEWSTNWHYWITATGSTAGQRPGDGDTVPGDDPDGTGGEPAPDVPVWTREYLILPNCTNGIFINNRLLVTTSWIPDAQFKAGAYGAKRDFVAATYVLDYYRYSPKNEFRINQGSADELQSLLKIGDTSVLALKSQSVGLLTNLTGDTLDFLSLEFIIRTYGVVNPRAATEAGRDAVFVSPRRGVVSLQQTEQNRIQGVERAFSDPIQPWINEIDWTLSDKIRLAYWNDALYLAAPVTSSESFSLNWLEGVSYIDVIDFSQDPFVRTGMTFRWDPSPDDSEWFLANAQVYKASVQVTWDGTSVLGIHRHGVDSQPNPAKSVLRRVIPDVNTAVIVYDYQTQQWQPIQRGIDLAVREWFVMTVDGIERLCCVTEDGYLNLYEESDAGDQVFNSFAPNFLGFAPIATRAATRGYTGGTAGFKAGQFARMVIATQAPRYTVRTRTEGVNEFSSLATDRFRDFRTYDRPAGVKRWVPDNSNADFFTPFRQDYSLYLLTTETPLDLSTGESLDLSTGFALDLSPQPLQLNLDNGLPVDLTQEANHSLRMVRQRGRWHQAIVENAEGILELRAVELELQETSRQVGIKV
jgi:hypothetical protein